jgi:hypothetical protein
MRPEMQGAEMENQARVICLEAAEEGCSFFLGPAGLGELAG